MKINYEMCDALIYCKSSMGVHTATDRLMRWMTTRFGSWVAVYKTSIFIDSFVVLINYASIAAFATCVVYSVSGLPKLNHCKNWLRVLTVMASCFLWCKRFSINDERSTVCDFNPYAPVFAIR